MFSISRRIVLVLAIGMLATLAVQPALGKSPPPSPAEPVIIKFRTPPSVEGPSAAASTQRVRDRALLQTDLARLAGGTPRIRYDYRNAFNGIATDLPPDAANAVRKLPYVEAVYPDSVIHTTLLESVPLIGADQVWDQFGVTGTGIRVAIVDTGVDYTHADLGGCFGPGCKVAGGYDFINDDASPIDDYGHGTHVAGIVAADGVVKGVAPDATLLAYKVLDASGSGSDSTVIAGIDAAVDPDGNPLTPDGAQVINLSLGGPGGPDGPASQAVDNAVAAGVTVVVSAGNSGPGSETIGSPGTARGALTVGASDKFDVIAGFSSRGPVIWEGGAILKPDIVAPGVAICSSRWGTAWTGFECIDSGHVALDGTSMAAPHVAGVVALLLQLHPTWSPAEMKAALRGTALDIGEPPATQGYGRLRALNAVQLDHAPPVAEIATSGGMTVPTNISGTATSGAFQDFSLYLGAGTDPSSWTLIGSSSSPVSGGTLATGFDPTTMPSGLNTLRLVVRDTSGLSSEDRAFVERASPPPNDALAAAIDVTPLPFTDNQNTRYATTEVGEPTPVCVGSTSHSVWYTFTPSVTGSFVVDTVSSDYDTVLAIAPVSNPAAQLCNDDINFGQLQSRISFVGDGGVAYRIQVNGFSSASGHLTLHVAGAPINDNLADAISIGNLPFTDTQNTVNATTEAGETPQSCVFQSGHSVWYTLTPSFSSNFQLDTFTSDYDTVLGVTALSGPPTQLCNDDTAAGLQSSITFAGSAGITYRVQVSGFSAVSGNLVFHAQALGCAGIDTDADGICNTEDNCPSVVNPLQEWSDRNFVDQTPPSLQDDRTVANSDATGDACDTDDDNDGILDAAEAVGCNGGASSPTNRDADGDRTLDGAECALGTNPGNAASKPTAAQCAAQVGVGVSVDTDGDKILDRIEYCGYNTNRLLLDTDGDQDATPLNANPAVNLIKDGCEAASLNNDRTVNSADQLLIALDIAREADQTLRIANMDINKDGGVNSGDQLLLVGFITVPGSCP